MIDSMITDLNHHLCEQDTIDLEGLAREEWVCQRANELIADDPKSVIDSLIDNAEIYNWPELCRAITQAANGHAALLSRYVTHAAIVLAVSEWPAYCESQED